EQKILHAAVDVEFGQMLGSGRTFHECEQIVIRACGASAEDSAELTLFTAIGSRVSSGQECAAVAVGAGEFVGMGQRQSKRAVPSHRKSANAPARGRPLGGKDALDKV